MEMWQSYQRFPVNHELIYDALRDLVPFVQFKKGENTHGGVFLSVKLQALSMGVFHVL